MVISLGLAWLGSPIMNSSICRADVGVLWLHMVEETEQPGENIDFGRPTTNLQYFDTGIRSQDGKRVI